MLVELLCYSDIIMRQQQMMKCFQSGALQNVNPAVLKTEESYNYMTA